MTGPLLAISRLYAMAAHAGASLIETMVGDYGLMIGVGSAGIIVCAGLIVFSLKKR